MGNVETSNKPSIETRFIGTNCIFEHPIPTPELCEDFFGLIMNESPAGFRIGIECSQKIIKGFPEEVIHKCKEKGIVLVGLVDEALCVKREEVCSDFKQDSQDTENTEIKKFYFGQPQKDKALLDYFTVKKLPNGILKNVQKDNFDLVILSRETLKYVGDDIEKIRSNKEIRLALYDDFNNYPDRIDNSYGDKLSDISKITYAYLSTF